MIHLPLASTTWNEDEINIIQDITASGTFTMGEKVAEYENNFADFFGSTYAVMTNSGSSANLIMVASLFLKKTDKLHRGDEIIVPALSWSTTYFPLQQYGLKLVFVDVDQSTLNFDLQKLKRAISTKTKAICAVNILGNPNDFALIKEMVNDLKIIILEDNCQSMGAQFKDQYTGTFGLMGTFSTFYSHHISTMEGGCVLTNDEELYHILLALRAHGWTRDLPRVNQITGAKNDDAFEESFKFVVPGYNVRPTEVSGAIGNIQLKKLPGFIRSRRENAAIFQEIFDGHPYIQIQKETGLSSWYGFSLVIKESAGVNRQELITELTKNGVATRPIASGSFLKQEVIKYFDYRVDGEIEATDYIDKNGFYIGNHHFDIKPQLTEISKILQ